ncbi:MAG: DUF4105 domain-containing protein [Rhodothermales bacterium]
MSIWIRAALTALFLLICRPAAAQLSEQARISLITILPGDQIYSLWGHSAVRVYDPVQGIDVSFNYGTFSFEDDWFVWRFMSGELNYVLSLHDFQAALHHYEFVEKRSVVEQELQLSAPHRDSLYLFLQINHLPENRSYRYDILFDNCSTRIRDAFERTLGADLRFAGEPDPGKTFRELLHPYHIGVPFLDAGIDWLLGSPVDRVAKPYETMFLPDYLMLAFDGASIRVDNDWRPLVIQTHDLVRIDAGERAPLPWASIFAWLLLTAGVVLTVRAVRSGRREVRALDVPLFLMTGIAGLLIVFLWFFSLHGLTDRNWHLMWAWPTHVVAAYALAWRKAWIRPYVVLAAAAALLAVVSSLLWPQEFHPALYPIALLLAVRGGSFAFTKTLA